MGVLLLAHSHFARQLVRLLGQAQNDDNDGSTRIRRPLRRLASENDLLSTCEIDRPGPYSQPGPGASSLWAEYDDETPG
jgi:hypothetical protein